MVFNFNLKKAVIFQAVKWERNPIFRFAKFFKKLFFILFFLTLLGFLYGFLFENFSQKLNSQLLGFSIIFLVFAISCWVKESFFNLRLKKPKLKVKLEEAVLNPEKYNLAEFLSFESAKAVWRARNDSTILFYHLLCDNPELNFVFTRAILNLNEIKKLLKQYLTKIPKRTEKEFQPEFQAIILDALKIAQEKNHQTIGKGDMIVALAKHDLIFKKILIDLNLKIGDIDNLVRWLEFLEEKIEGQKKFWEYKNLAKRGTLAKEWAAGYTITLDRFSIDWSEVMKKRGFPEMIGHKKEIEIMERILSRRESKNNVLIVGEPGSGRKSIIQALARKSVLGESLSEVNYKRIVQLDLTALLTKTENLEEIESVLDTIFKEVIIARNVILIIDEFHNYVGTTTLRPGTIDISGIISPYLALVSFQIVAVTTFGGLHKNIEQNPSVLSLFEKVEVSEISEKETLILLENLTLRLEAKYKIFVSYPALRNIISLCDKYFPAITFPEKAMDLLDEVMVYVSQIKEKIVLPKHVAKIVFEKTQIPVGEIELKEREVLLKLEDLIHRRIINQDEAVKEVSSALRRARAEVTIKKKPMGTFLFLGPTGVGKTETSKALSEIYFGSEEKMIRLDMSEFQSIQDIPRLIGSPGEEGLLTTPVRESPFSLILLDEIEKAHPNILNLFLQVLDEGHLTDGQGRKVDFKNAIIIATSNAAAEIIWEALKTNKKLDIIKDDLLSYLFEKAIFRPEFINRFDGVVVFKPLTKENLFEIADLLLQKLKKNLKEKEIEFVISSALKERIVELGYDPKFGAREMKRVIQNKVENVLALALLSGELVRGQKVEVTSVFQLKIY